jgi:hypothetical protein
MIFHENKLINFDKGTKAAVRSFHKNVRPFDVFIIAADKKSSEKVKQMEKVAGGPFTKPAWVKAAANGVGIILTVNSNMFRRRANKPIMNAVEMVKRQFEGLTFEQYDHKQFTAFFFSYKPIEEEAKAAEQPA